MLGSKRGICLATRGSITGVGVAAQPVVNITIKAARRIISIPPEAPSLEALAQMRFCLFFEQIDEVEELNHRIRNVCGLVFRSWNTPMSQVRELTI
jgi:hypothetical protein